MATTDLTAEDETRVEEFAGRLFAACLGTMELASVEPGVQLRLYEALARAGQMTAGELANVAGIVERYAQEWLEQQAVAGVVFVDDASKPSTQRRFILPNAHAHVLTDDDGEACMKPCAAIVRGRARLSTSWSRSSATEPTPRLACSTCTTAKPRSRGRYSSYHLTQTGCRHCQKSRPS